MFFGYIVVNKQNNIDLGRKEAPAPGCDEGPEQALLIVGWVGDFFNVKIYFMRLTERKQFQNWE